MSYRGMFIRLGAVYAVVGLVAGCASVPQRVPEPRVITVEKPVPVASPCVPATLSAAPEYPDTTEALVAAVSPVQRYKLLSAGHPLRVARLNELEKVVAGCPKATQ